MPELPEVQTTINGLAPLIQHQEIKEVNVRCKKLRWPIPENLISEFKGTVIKNLSRRGKYILLDCTHGTIIIHLGRSGRLCLFTNKLPAQKHDHVDFIFSEDKILRYTDPRRFGAILTTNQNPLLHPLLKSLGVEPLTDDFNAAYLLKKTANRQLAIKPFIMDSKIVVGIGNIYAAEALFAARIHPAMPAGLLTESMAEKLILEIKRILNHAIRVGGTTLKDFVNGLGKPGYFSQQLAVYGREGLPCIECGQPLKFVILGQRRSVFCEHCQVN